MGKARLASAFTRHLVTGLAVVMVLGIYSYERPLPVLMPYIQNLPALPAKPVSLPWPSSGQAAIGADGFGVLASNNAGQPVPTASIAKIVTALAVLKQKPLALGQQGPTIKFDSTDVSYYQYFAAKGGSVAQVLDGETITEYQALQTMILPSANNIAKSLARWAFGSPEKYYAYANNFVITLGMTQTNIADASGFSPLTTATSKDLVRLGFAALNNPVLAQIVRQSQATLPVVGLVNNTNWLLGSDGFIGIKTGNTTEAGGCYLFASNHSVAGHNLTVVGAVLGANSLADAMASGKTLADATKGHFILITVAKSVQVVGNYRLPWGGSTQVVPLGELNIVRWEGEPIVLTTVLGPLTVPQPADSQVGTISFSNGHKSTIAAAIIKQPLTKPSIFWRTSHFWR